MLRIMCVIILIGVVATQGTYIFVYFFVSFTLLGFVLILPFNPSPLYQPCCYSVLFGFGLPPRASPVLQQGKAGRRLFAQIQHEQRKVRLAGGGPGGFLLRREGRGAVLYETSGQAALTRQ